MAASNRFKLRRQSGWRICKNQFRSIAVARSDDLRENAEQFIKERWGDSRDTLKVNDHGFSAPPFGEHRAKRLMKQSSGFSTDEDSVGQDVVDAQGRHDSGRYGQERQRPGKEPGSLRGAFQFFADFQRPRS